MADDTPSTPPSSMSPSTDRTGSLSPAGSTPSVAPTSADLPAQVGRYLVEGEMARGGMGVILRATDTALGREVAIKVLHERFVPDTAAARRFDDEARIAAQLQHPAIPPIHDLGTLPDGRPFLVMKRIKGHTLDVLLAARPDPCHDQGRFVAVFEQICQALAYAHAHRVIHRDLKPSNVMVGAFGEVQVMDWGLAKVLASRDGPRPEADPNETTGATEVRSLRDNDASVTQTGSVLGTPAYMAPEQARGQIDRLDERTDVFGLGAILCEVLTGKPPFTQGHSSVLIRRAARGELGDALTRLDGCGADGELIALARACLAAEAMDRPGDAGEVAARVAAYRAGVEQRLRQAELERAAAAARAQEARAKAVAEQRARRLTLGLAAAMLALMALGGGGAAWWWWQRADTIHTVETSLAEVRASLAQDRLPEARQALERAAGRLGSGGPPELRQRVDQARADVEMVHELDEIRLGQSDSAKDGNFDRASAGPKYARAFQRYQLDIDSLDPEEAVGRIRTSPIREQLVAALDNWSQVRKEKGESLRRIADGADDDAWRRRLRGVKTTEEARQLAARSEVWEQPPATVSRFASLLVDFRLHAEAVDGLRVAQQRHPGDFWINHYLGMHLKCLGPSRAAEAVGFLRAAVAVRPNSPGAHLNVGTALQDMKDLDGAIACYRKTLELDPNDAMAHNNLGNALRDNKEVDEAIACYHKALQLDPNFAVAHNNLGNALHDKGDEDGAMATFRKAIELDPKYAKAYCNLGAAFHDRKDVEEAIDCYRKALKLDPDNAIAYCNLGFALDRKKEYDQAIACYHKALQLDPNLAVVHTNLGNALQAKGDVDRAIACYRKALELDPSFAMAYSSLGTAFSAKGDVDGAIDYYCQALQFDPRLAQAHVNFGNALFRKKDLDGAIACYRKAIELRPKYFLAYCNLGAALKARGDVDEAIDNYCQALHLDPNNAATYFNLGLALQAKKDDDGAIAYYRKAIELNGNDADAHNNLGNALYRKGDMDRAITCYRTAIKLDPNDAAAYHNLGRVWAQKKKWDEAIACFHKAIERNPKDADAHNNLGLALLGKKDVDGAIACFRKAVQTDPNLAYAHFNLGRALVDKGDVSGAIASYRNAIEADPHHAEAHCNLAGLLRHQGHLKAAQAEYHRGHELGSPRPDWPYSSAQWVREIDRLVALEEKAVAILKREARPAGAAELLDLAQVCYLTRRYTAASRFANDAFRAEPQRADDPRASHRYLAASSAALAGTGQGDDAPQDDRGRADLRAQALAWLRADLNAWKRLVTDGNPIDRADADATLRDWRQDIDLSRVRHPWTLLRLPADERRQWQRLWADVDELLKKASKTAM